MLAPVAALLPPACPGVGTWLMIGDTPAGWQSYAAEVAAQPADRIADETAGADMLYSSGTTGRPKGVFVPPELPDIDASSPLLALAGRIYQMDGDTVYLSPAPLYHAAPLRFNMTVHAPGRHLRGDGTLRRRRLPAPGPAAPHHPHPAGAHDVRAHAQAARCRAQVRLSSLKCAIHAAAPCPVPVKEQMIAWWGPVMMEYYAGTEGNGLTMVQLGGVAAHKGTVGPIGWSCTSIGDDEGEEVPTGRERHHLLRGRPSSSTTTTPRRPISRAPQGWSTLGDVGYGSMPRASCTSPTARPT
jgi:long-chain acyl-CoA synthetase